MGRSTENPTIRILLLGSVGVGKNGLESRFTTKTYPPPYNPEFTLNSRRYFTLSPPEPIVEGGIALADARTNEFTNERSSKDEGRTFFTTLNEQASTGSLMTSSTEVAQKLQTTNGSDPELNHNEETAILAVGDSASNDKKTPIVSETCRMCAEEKSTYLVEVTNFPQLQDATVRAEVHKKAEYDAIMLVYDVTDRNSFEAVRNFYQEIPVSARRHHKKCHSRAASSKNATRDRSSGWFGGGGYETPITGSGEIVVGLVGNKCDNDENESQQVNSGGSFSLVDTKGIAATEQQDGIAKDRPLESIQQDGSLHEQLAASTEQEPRMPISVSFSEKPKSTAMVEEDTPMTPFPMGLPPASPRLLPGKSTTTVDRWPQPVTPKKPFDEIIKENMKINMLGQQEHLMKDTEAQSASMMTVPASLTRKRLVSHKEGEELSKELHLQVPFFETSARTGLQVEAAFESLIREILKGFDNGAKKSNKARKRCRHTTDGTVTQQSQRRNETKKGQNPIANGKQPALDAETDLAPGVKAQLSVDAVPITNKATEAMDEMADHTSDTRQPIGDEASAVHIRQVRRRESIMDRMRHMFGRKQVMMADVAV